jgi:hypothetical protein
VDLGVQDILRMTRLLTALSLVLQGLEYFALGRRLDALRGRFPRPFFFALVVVQSLAVAWFFDPSPDFPLGLPVFFAALLISLHFRGHFNGGADAMTLVVLSALAAIEVFPSNPAVLEGALIYVGAQSFLSYVVAGGAKIRKSAWRSGFALQDYAAHSSYAFPDFLTSALKTRAVALGLSWSVMVFELALVPTLYFPRSLPIWMGLGALFHVANFFTLGLNRFVFAWIATYPALFYLAVRFSA